MDSKLFFRVMSVFQEACNLEEPARSRFLDEACAGAPDIRREVEAMLAVDAEASAPIDVAGAGAHLLAAHLAIESAADEDPGPGIPSGPSSPLTDELFADQYRIIRLLGEGGMGRVYEAEQARPRRIVALKLIRQGLDSAGVLRRFEHEAHILGRLQHSGIAQIYEAGYSKGPGGSQAFIAMEYVNGPPLTEYVESRELNSRERLQLMIRVCDAVQHAHQRGIIHRDLKPGNILVVDNDDGSTTPAGEGSRGGEPASRSGRSGSMSESDRVGQPKVLDFGVARAADAEQQLTTMHTMSGQLVGTLAYMSPEQVAGEPDQIDVRSDIYALGVVMYQVLTGRLPFDIKSKSIPEAVMVIRDAEAPTLSSIDIIYRGDVETIVAKALQKDKERRYQSAAELADDIRRHLAGEPISAKRDSAMYILRSRLRRYRLFLGASAVFALLVIGSVIWLSVLYRRQGRLLDAVEEQRDRAMIASRIANERLTEANEAREHEQQERDRAERAADRAESVNAFLQEMLASVDPMLARGPELSVRELLDQSAERIESGSLKDEPDIEAETRLTIGRAYLRLEKFEKAKHHIERALEINRTLYPDDSVHTAESIAELAEIERANGDMRSAEEHSLEAVEMFRRLHRRTRMFAIALNIRGMTLVQTARYAEAEEYLKEAMAVWVEVRGKDHIEVAGAKQNLGMLYMASGRETEAEKLFEESAEVFRSRLGPSHPYVGIAMNNLGAIAFRRGDIDAAERLLTGALEIRRGFFGPDSTEYIDGLSNLGLIATTRGDHALAEKHYREALEIERKVLRAGHPNIARTLEKLGMLLQSVGRLDEAEEYYREGLDIRRTSLGEDSPEVATDLSNLASLYADRGLFDEAEKMHRQALDIRRQSLPDGHRDISSSLAMLASTLVNLGRYEDAEPLARESLEIRSRVYPGHWLHASAATRLGAVLIGLEKYEEAEKLLQQGHEIISDMPYVPPAQREEAMYQLISLYEFWGKPEQASEWRAKLDAFKETTSQPAVESP